MHQFLLPIWDDEIWGTQRIVWTRWAWITFWIDQTSFCRFRRMVELAVNFSVGMNDRCNQTETQQRECQQSIGQLKENDLLIWDSLKSNQLNLVMVRVRRADSVYQGDLFKHSCEPCSWGIEFPPWKNCDWSHKLKPKGGTLIIDVKTIARLYLHFQHINSKRFTFIV